MKNLIKKNQLMITALAIMIAIAGYLQFAGTDLEDEYLTVDDSNVYPGDASMAGSGGIVTENYTAGELLDLSAEDLLQEGITDISSLDSDLEDEPVENYLDADFLLSENMPTDGKTDSTPGSGEIPGTAVFTSAQGVAILSEAKLLKEQTRARNKATLMEIINSAGLTDVQKQDAVDSMVRMTEIAEKEAAAEILLEAKGYAGAVVSINDGVVDVVVNATALDDVMRAQIEDIVKRKTEIASENIIISTLTH